MIRLALRALDAVSQASGWCRPCTARHVPRHRLQLLHRPRRPTSRPMSRRWWNSDPRRGPARDQARLLRGRCRPRRQSQHAQRPDRGRHRIRDDHRAQEQDHILERRHRSEQLLRLSAARPSTRCRRSFRSFLPSDRPPQGVGEVVLPPLAPAIAQAVFHATGRRLDVMPFPDNAVQPAPGCKAHQRG